MLHSLGRTSSLNDCGSHQLIDIVIVVLQLALVTHYWTWMSHVSTWGSIILFFLSTITFNSETWLVRCSNIVMCKLGRDIYS